MGLKLLSPFTKKQAQRDADSLGAAGVSLCLLFSLRNGEILERNMKIRFIKTKFPQFKADNIADPNLIGHVRQLLLIITIHYRIAKRV